MPKNNSAIPMIHPEGISGSNIVFDLDGTLVYGDLGEAVFFQIILGVAPSEVKEIYRDGEIFLDSISGSRKQMLYQYMSFIQKDEYERACRYLAKEICSYPKELIQSITEDILEKNEIPKRLYIQQDKSKRTNQNKLCFGAQRRSDLIQLLDKLISAGGNVWIVSASPQPIVEIFGNSIGVSPEKVLAVRVEKGEVVLCPYGPGKVEALHKHGVEKPLIVFGNSRGDIDILEISKTPFVMDSSEEMLLEIAQERSWSIYRPDIFESVFE